MCRALIRQNARDVLAEAAAGNVGQCLDALVGANGSQQGLYVNACRLDQRFAKCPGFVERRRLCVFRTADLDDLADQ
jgi:hypothetical protein